MWKYLNVSEVILSLYDKTIMHVSSCPNSNLISIKAQLNSTCIIVFTVSIYVTHIKFYGLDDQGFNSWQGKKFILSEKSPDGLKVHPAS